MLLVFSLVYSFALFCTSGAGAASPELYSPQNNHLWLQIGSKIATVEVNKLQSIRSALHACTANALSEHGTKYPAINEELMQAIDSLHLISNVMPRLSMHNLQHGYFCFAKNICQISSDIKELEHRQDIIRYFLKNTAFATELNELLQTLQSTEIDYLWIFYPKAEGSSAENFEGAIVDRFADIYFSIRKRIESNRYLSENWQRWKQLALGGMFLLTAQYLYKTDENGLGACKNAAINSWSSYLNLDPLVPKSTMREIVSSRGVVDVLTVSTFLTTAAGLINMTYAIKQEFDDIHRKQKSLFHINKLLATATQVSKLISQHPDIIDLIPELATIEKFSLDTQRARASLSPKMKRLISLLHSSSFKGSPNYWLSWQGKIIETYSVYEDVKSEFVPLWEALGTLDAQLCTNKLIRSQDAQFCLPIWVDSAQPVLIIKDYWHPGLNHSDAVKNSIALGGNPRPRNAVITGANAGGKTTALTAIMIGQILAQSIGIVPASELQATPFTKFHTYLDITTNLAAGESLFMAQANRAEKLYKSISSCAQGEKAITILDEIFTGTRADFAENASFEFAQTLGNMGHSICILATHFPKLTELESLNLFLNYHAANATIYTDGTMKYPYKIIPGISTQNIAEHILKQKGILNR